MSLTANGFNAPTPFFSTRNILPADNIVKRPKEIASNRLIYNLLHERAEPVAWTFGVRFQCFQSTLAHPNQCLHLCNVNLFLQTVESGVELIAHAFTLSKVLGIRNLELDSSISHRKMIFLNYNKLANSQMAHFIQTIFITFYSYCLINKTKQK